ncbi:Brwd3, partial [Symbiodinium sp. KB8]
PCRLQFDGSLLAVLGAPDEGDDEDDVDTDLTVDHVAFAPAGQALIALCEDGHARVWRWGRGFAKPWQTTLSPWDGETAAAQDEARRRQVEARLGASAPMRQFNGGLGFDDAQWSAGGRVVVTTQSRELTRRERDGASQSLKRGKAPLELCAVKVWDAATGELLHRLPAAHSGRTQALAMHPTDDRVCATGGADGLVVVWALDHGEKAPAPARALRRLRPIFPLIR